MGNNIKHCTISTILLVDDNCKHIQESMACLEAQSIQPHEIILVDQTQNTGLAQDEISKVQTSIPVKNYAPAGAGETNALLQASTLASGAYIFTLYGNDHIPPHTFEKLVENIDDTHADICLLRNTVNGKDSKQPAYNSLRPYSYSNWCCEKQHAILSLLQGEVTPLNRNFGILAKTDLFVSLAQTLSSKPDSEFFIFQLLEQATKISFCYDIPYTQVIEDSSKHVLEKTLQNLIAYQNWLQPTERSYPNYLPIYYSNYFKMLDTLKDTYKQANSEDAKHYESTIKELLLPFYLSHAKNSADGLHQSARMKMATRLFLSSPAIYKQLF